MRGDKKYRFGRRSYGTHSWIWTTVSYTHLDVYKRQVQENAEDILAEAQQINEKRAQEEAMQVQEDDVQEDGASEQEENE